MHRASASPGGCEVVGYVRRERSTEASQLGPPRARLRDTLTLNQISLDIAECQPTMTRARGFLFALTQGATVLLSSAAGDDVNVCASCFGVDCGSGLSATGYRECDGAHGARD